MTPVDMLILLLENFQTLRPIEQLGTAAGCVGALSGSIFWTWRKGRKYVAQLVETNGKLKQELKDSAVRTRKIEQQIEEHGRTLASLQAQVPAVILAHAAAEKAHAREILSKLFDQLAPAVATCCREILEVELALALVDAGDRPNLQQVKQLAQAAVLLVPEGERGLRDLLAEINVIRPVWEEEHGVSRTAMLRNAAFAYVGEGRPDVAIPLLQRVYETGRRRYQEGHYAVAAVLLRRAALLAHRNFGSQHPYTLETRGAGPFR